MFVSPQARASLANFYSVSQLHLMSALSRFISEQFKGSILLDMQEAIEKCHSQIVH